MYALSASAARARTSGQSTQIGVEHRRRRPCARTLTLGIRLLRRRRDAGACLASRAQ